MNTHGRGGEFGGERFMPGDEEGKENNKETTIEKLKEGGLLDKAGAIAGAARETIEKALGKKHEEGVPKKPETLKPQSEMERKTTKPKEEHLEVG